MNDPELLSRVAKKIRQIRTQKNLTLQQISDQAQVSKGLLSKIENSRTVPSLPVFLSIVNSLNVPLNEFFDGMELPDGKDYIHISSTERKPINKEDREGFDYQFILSQNVSPATLQAVILTVKPGAKSKTTTTDGFQLKYVLSGTCDYFIGEEKIKLVEGDTLYLDGTKPHMPVNRGPDLLVMLVIYLLTIK